MNWFRKGCPLVLLGLLAASATAHALDTRAFVTTTDYSSGGLRAANLDPPSMIAGETAVCTDTRIRWHDGRVWVINRFGCDNVQIVDPATLGTIHQWSTGNGSNPSDVAFASGRVYVTRYELPTLLVMNPETGATIKTINLGAFADADGIPEMDRMERWGPYLFVSCQRLDRNHNFALTDTSLVVVVDTRADTVVDVNPGLPGVQAIVLGGRNPTTPFVFDPVSGRLLIGCTGAYGAYDGGIDAIDPATLTSQGFVITEAALGGDLTGIAWYSPTHAYAIVSDVGFNTLLVSWNPTTHAKLATVYSPGGFSLGDLALDDHAQLWVTNNNFTGPGLFVYRANVDTLIAGPIDTGLPPNQITLDHATGDAAGVGASPALRLAVSPPQPNPARSLVRLAVESPEGGFEASVFDVGGRIVRRLSFAGARGELTWDLADQGGNRVRSGIYFVRVRTRSSQITRTVVVTR